MLKHLIFLVIATFLLPFPAYLWAEDIPQVTNENDIATCALPAEGDDHDSEIASELDLARWVGETQLGFEVTDGTTELRTISGSLDLVKDGKKWRNQIVVEAKNVAEKKSTAAERYFASVKTEYKYETEEFLFAQLDYENDRFSGFAYDTIFTGGLGRDVINLPRHRLSLEIGPGYQRTESIDHVRDENIVLRAAGIYRYSLSDTAELEQGVEVISDEDDVTETRSTTAIRSQINGHLALQVSLKVKHSSVIPEVSASGDEVEKTEFETAFQLVYTFL